MGSPLYHRRQVLIAFGPESESTLARGPELTITSILLGSAVINIPVAILAAIMALREGLLFADAIRQIIVPLQVL